MTSDEELPSSSLRRLGDSELDDAELDRRVIKFQSALRRLRDDPAEAARIDVLVTAAEPGQADVKAADSDLPRPAPYRRSAIGYLLARWQSRRRGTGSPVLNRSRDRARQHGPAQPRPAQRRRQGRDDHLHLRVNVTFGDTGPDEHWESALTQREAKKPEEDHELSSAELSSADRIWLLPALLLALTGLISSAATVPGYWKLGIAVSAVGIGAIVLFLGRVAWRRAIRRYRWLGPLIAGTAAGLVVGVLVLSRGGHPIWAPAPAPGPPPGAGTVTVLMDEEAAAEITRDTTTVSQIYAPDAVVKDAACGSPGSSFTWTGLSQIKARYLALPRFTSLRHVDAEVRWEPDNSLAATATVTAQTVGVMESSAGSLQYIHGNEAWTFARVGGTWVITSFTYNVCS